jgi:hypothetical protein
MFSCRVFKDWLNESKNPTFGPEILKKYSNTTQFWFLDFKSTFGAKVQPFCKTLKPSRARNEFRGLVGLGGPVEYNFI